MQDFDPHYSFKFVIRMNSVSHQCPYCFILTDVWFIRNR